MRSVFSVAPVVMLGLLLAGCSGNGTLPAPPDRPEKPVQAWVTLSVPEMMCEGCTESVKRRLGALEWVEYSTIKADLDTKKVKFGVNDVKHFDADALREALGDHYGKGMEVIKGPGPK